MKINERIKCARREQLLSQKDVAKMAGVDTASVCRAESGKNGSVIMLLKICKALGIDYDN